MFPDSLTGKISDSESEVTRSSRERGTKFIFELTPTQKSSILNHKKYSASLYRTIVVISPRYGQLE